MPLPAALAARLAKRGLLKTEVVEEVIAEDYDDLHTNQAPVPAELESDGMMMDENDCDELIYECLACPNRSNVYHACGDYCRKRWGYKRFKPDTELARKRERLLSRYPPPPGWAEVGDPGTGRYYYWNVETDEVSWLPPLHPRADISLSAERIKELKLLADANRLQDGDSQGESSDDSTDLDDEDDIREQEQESDKRSNKKQDRGRKRQRDDLDPMDPAAYSDVPRGDWSTGLDQRGSAKTGVDVTVSGPLFQQRPYPSPGAVLRMNNQGGKTKAPAKPKAASSRK